MDGYQSIVFYGFHKGLFSGFQKQRFGIFQAAVSQWLGHKTCWGSAFSHARPKHVFHGFCLVACGLSSRTLRKGLPCLRQPFFFVFSRFQKQRFGIFQAAVSQWLGHKTCWGSAFSHARPTHVFHGFCLVACGLSSLTLRKGLPCLRQPFFFVFSRFQKQRFGIFLAAVSHAWGTISLFLVGSKSDVSAFFRLRFRNGLGTKPAGVLLFRMRVPSTFFMGFVWWLAGFQVLRCAKVCLA